MKDTWENASAMSMYVMMVYVASLRASRLLIAKQLADDSKSGLLAMLVAAANEFHITFLCTQIPYVNIRRQIHACQVANMNRAIGIW